MHPGEGYSFGGTLLTDHFSSPKGSLALAEALHLTSGARDEARLGHFSYCVLFLARRHHVTSPLPGFFGLRSTRDHFLLCAIAPTECACRCTPQGEVLAGARRGGSGVGVVSPLRLRRRSASDGLVRRCVGAKGRSKPSCLTLRRPIPSYLRQSPPFPTGLYRSPHPLGVWGNSFGDRRATRLRSGSAPKAIPVLRRHRRWTMGAPPLSKSAPFGACQQASFALLALSGSVHASGGIIC
jgi:hypothetical protein